MANVERHDFFPTCLYRFKHSFQDNELNQMQQLINIATVAQRSRMQLHSYAQHEMVATRIWTKHVSTPQVAIRDTTKCNERLHERRRRSLRPTRTHTGAPIAPAVDPHERGGGGTASTSGTNRTPRGAGMGGPHYGRPRSELTGAKFW